MKNQNIKLFSILAVGCILVLSGCSTSSFNNPYSKLIKKDEAVTLTKHKDTYNVELKLNVNLLDKRSMKVNNILEIERINKNIKSKFEFSYEDKSNLQSKKDKASLNFDMECNDNDSFEIKNLKTAKDSDINSNRYVKNIDKIFPLFLNICKNSDLTYKKGDVIKISDFLFKNFDKIGFAERSFKNNYFIVQGTTTIDGKKVIIAEINKEKPLYFKDKRLYNGKIKIQGYLLIEPPYKEIYEVEYNVSITGEHKSVFSSLNLLEFNLKQEKKKN